MARCFMLAELRRKPRDRLSLRRNLNSSSLTDSTNIKELISMSRILMTPLMMKDSAKNLLLMEPSPLQRSCMRKDAPRDLDLSASLPLKRPPRLSLR